MTVWWGIFFLLYGLALTMIAATLPMAWLAAGVSILTGVYILAEIVNRRSS